MRTMESRREYIRFQQAQVQPAIRSMRAALTAYQAFCDELGAERFLPRNQALSNTLWEAHSQAFEVFRALTRKGEAILEGELTYEEAMLP